MRWSVPVAAVAALLGVGTGCSAPPDVTGALQPGSRDVYWIAQSFRKDDESRGIEMHQMSTLEVLPEENGEPGVLGRTLWLEVSAVLGGMTSLDLDETREDHRALLQVLGQGMTLRMDRHGRLTRVELVARDELESLAGRSSALAEALGMAREQQGMPLLIAPANPKPGHEVRQSLRLPELAELDVRMTLHSVADGVSHWELASRGRGNSLSGFARFPEEGGLPIEMGMELSLTVRPEPEEPPVTVHGRVAIQNQRYMDRTVGYVLRDDLLDFFVDMARDTWPFSDEGGTEPFMVQIRPEFFEDSFSPVADPAWQARLQESLFFYQAPPEQEAYFFSGTDLPEFTDPWLTLVLEPGPIWELEGTEAIYFTGVRLLGADGEPLPGLDVEVNRAFESALLRGERVLNAASVGFPFRVPLDQGQLFNVPGLAAIELDLELGRWVVAEKVTLAYGEQPEAHWHTEVIWDRTEPALIVQGDVKKQRVTPVLLDAEGESMRSAMETAPDRVVRRLRGETVDSWLTSGQLDREPMHSLLRGEQPVESILLLRTVPERQLLTVPVQNAAPVLAGEAVVGRRYAADNVALDDLSDLAARLDSLVLEAGETGWTGVHALRAPGGKVEAAALAQACTLTDPQGEWQAGEVAWQDDENGYWHLGGGWNGPAGAQRGTVTVRCEHRLVTVRESLADSECLDWQATGQLTVREGCADTVVVPSLRALDEKGRALLRFLDHAGESRIWGKPAEVEYWRLAPGEPVTRRLAYTANEPG